MLVLGAALLAAADGRRLARPSRRSSRCRRPSTSACTTSAGAIITSSRAPWPSTARRTSATSTASASSTVTPSWRTSHGIPHGARTHSRPPAHARRAGSLRRRV